MMRKGVAAVVTDLLPTLETGSPVRVDAVAYSDLAEEVKLIRWSFGTA